MRGEIKLKRTVDRFLIIIVALCIAAMLLMWEGYKNDMEAQEYLKSGIVTDNDWLTKRNLDLENQIKLLEEYVKTQDIMIKKQQETIDRLMKLEAVGEVQAVAAAEARGEPLSGQCAVIQTMIDRSTAWDMTVKEAIEAPGQYAPPYRGEINDSVETAFWLVFLDGYRVFDGDTLHFATYEPYWAENKTYRGTRGSHHYWGPIE